MTGAAAKILLTMLVVSPFLIFLELREIKSEAKEAAARAERIERLLARIEYNGRRP